ncbi:MAG: putative porin [Bacteroidota bacterium]
MKKILSFISLTLFALPVFSQSTIDPLDWYKGVSKDSIQRYKIYHYDGDSTHVDSTLTIKKYFRHNLLRKDDLLLLKFANQGENYNLLSYQEGHSLIPQIGFKTKQQNFLEKEDINYYDVATPFTELALRTGYYRGQFLDAIFAANINPNLNFSVGYKGLRSVGRYKNSLTSQGNMQATVNYKTKNRNYRLKAHVVFQDLLNNESGGIEDDLLFTTGNPDFATRTAFSMNLERESVSLLKGKRLYINHYYMLPFEISELGGRAFIQHIGNAETKYFKYSDKVSTNKYFFGSDVFNTSETNDSTSYQFLQNDLLMGVRGKHGRSYLKAGIGYNYQNYGYDTLKVISDNQVIPAYMKGSTVSMKASGRIFPLENLDIEAHGSYNISGKYIDAFELFGQANYKLFQEHKLSASLGIYSYYPESQFWLYQSNYKQYNYFNLLEKQNKLDFKFSFESPKWVDAHIRYVIHSNYTFFDAGIPYEDVEDGHEIPENAVVPVKTVQYDEVINLIETGIHKDIKFGVFGLDTRTVFQKVLSGEEVLRIPEIVTRNTIYYQDDWFRHALQVQTGVSVKYFTEFSSYSYNPLIGAYYRPGNEINTNNTEGTFYLGSPPENDTKIGNYPLFNFFFNARIRTIRIFFEVENFTSPAGNYNYFSAPHYPGADLSIRFGLVWNFFT